MNHIDEHDNLDDRLIKSGDYLMKRAVQYREQPVVTTPMRRTTSPRMRRVLVGTAAAATLTVTAVAGSFIGGTSSGKVEVAKAAWSAVPATPTAEQVNKVKLDCGITAEILATSEMFRRHPSLTTCSSLHWLTFEEQRRRQPISPGPKPNCVSNSGTEALTHPKSR